MKYVLISFIMITTTTISVTAQSPLNLSAVRSIEHQLDDVMELIDTGQLKLKLQEVEADFEQAPTEINQARLGIIYHETALNLSFLAKNNFNGYAQKSFDVLGQLLDSSDTSPGLLPYVSAYRASALSLVGAETKKLGLLGEAFKLFDEAVRRYADVSYLPEFLRGSVAENLPWFFFSKKRYAKVDFSSIIAKYEQNSTYANPKIMSFTYWAWAKQRQGKKYRVQALAYLDKAIALDPGYEAGRKKAEELKSELMKKST